MMKFTMIGGYQVFQRRRDSSFRYQMSWQRKATLFMCRQPKESIEKEGGDVN